MDLQGLIDAMNSHGKSVRADYHMTLGGLIERLEGMDGSSVVKFSHNDMYPGDLGSYRGYYSDLSLEPTTDEVTVERLLKDLKDALGNSFEGYKGGDFTMDSKTPLWASPYGSANGVGVMEAVEANGVVVLVTKQID